MSCSPRDQALLPPSSAEQGFVTARLGRRNSANLTPASGRQDHTILPSAATSLVSVLLIAHGFKEPALRSDREQNAAASTASRPASVTIAIRPSMGRDNTGIEVIWGSGEQNYFCERDSTDPFSGSPSGKSLPMKPAAMVGVLALNDALIVAQIN